MCSAAAAAGHLFVCPIDQHGQGLFRPDGLDGRRHRRLFNGRGGGGVEGEKRRNILIASAGGAGGARSFGDVHLAFQTKRGKWGTTMSFGKEPST
jgi:hypothetical protein